jgi:hypothetical protein
MRPRTQLVALWLALAGTLAASGYAFLSVYFYAWLQASGSWSQERASAWSFGAFVVAVLLFGAFLLIAVRLRRFYKGAVRE